MSTITMPLWVLLLGIGLPVITLIALIIGLIRAKWNRQRRQSQKEINPSIPGMTNYQFNSDIYKMILDQQIDTVFLSLSTILETEKIKLKTLMGGHNFMEQNTPEQASHHRSTEMAAKLDVAQSDDPATDDLADIITAKATMGMKPKEIARDMDLSLSEVVLALRMNNGSHDIRAIGGQLEAVA